jgi:hypothetical protein
MSISSHNRSTVSYDLKEKQSLNRKFDDADERKFDDGLKNLSYGKRYIGRRSGNSSIFRTADGDLCD